MLLFLWCWRRLLSPLDCKEIKPANHKGNQSWIFIGRTDAEVETPILWPPDTKNWLLGKDPDAGKDWKREEKGTTEDEMVGWHHRCNGYEFEQAPGVGEGQGSLACCGSWSNKESDTTEWLNWLKDRLLLVKAGWSTRELRPPLPTENRKLKRGGQGCCTFGYFCRLLPASGHERTEFQEEAEFSRILYRKEGRTPPPHYPSLQTHLEALGVSSFRPKLPKKSFRWRGRTNPLMPGTEGSGLPSVDPLHHKTIQEKKKKKKTIQGCSAADQGHVAK